MVRIFGNYTYESGENVETFKETLGHPYMRIVGLMNSNIEITEDNNKWIFRTIIMGENQIVTFSPIDNECREIIPSGQIIQCSANWDGNVLLICFETGNGDILIRECEFTEDGVIFTIRIVGVSQVATTFFKRGEIGGPAPEVDREPLPARSLPSIATKAAIIGGSAILGAGVAIAAAPVAVAALGFTSAGIAAGSFAATMMSALGGGATAAGGLVATMQSIGALGTVLGSAAATSAAVGTGATLGTAVGAAVSTAIPDQTNTSSGEEPNSSRSR